GPVEGDDREAAHGGRPGELAASHGLEAVSMGMTADYEVAVEEGATLVRIGTALFGPRPTGPGTAAALRSRSLA
ncbi:MAG TPA: hypothetical protein VG846_02140, partial [Actinomycetota bacterium]|nr:hypothetical protein [Actinomycetota bacterium]